MGALDGSVAMVTGAANGIGVRYAESLAAAGCSVAIVDLDLDLTKAESLAERIRSSGGKAVAVGMDVSDEASVNRGVAKLVGDLGHIGILVNNAALSDVTFGKKSFLEISGSEWDRMMAVNVRGPWLTARAVTPSMRSLGRGKIVNLVSTLALRGGPGIAHYATSKAAVIGLTRTLAIELGPHNVNVNAIAPGLTVTSGTKAIYSPEAFAAGASRRALKRDEYPDDIVGTLLFLCSKESDFITGQTIFVNGGDWFN